VTCCVTQKVSASEVIRASTSVPKIQALRMTGTPNVVNFYTVAVRRPNMSSPPSSIDIDVASDKPYCAGVDNKFFIPVAASLVNRRLFGLIEVPFVRYELSKSYVDQFRTLSGKHPICEVALLQCDAKLSNLFPGFEMPDCDGLKLKSLRVIHRVSESTLIFIHICAYITPLELHHREPRYSRVAHRVERYH